MKAPTDMQEKVEGWVTYGRGYNCVTNDSNIEYLTIAPVRIHLSRIEFAETVSKLNKERDLFFKGMTPIDYVNLISNPLSYLGIKTQSL